MGNKTSVQKNNHEELFRLIKSGSEPSDIISYIEDNNIDVYGNNDVIFLHTCSLGKKKVALWLYNEYYLVQPHDIHRNNDEMLKFLIANACDDMITWFMTLGTFDIRQSDDIFLNIACDCNKVELCKTLEKMVKEYRIETKLLDNVVIPDGSYEDSAKTHELMMVDVHTLPNKPYSEHQFVNKLRMTRLIKGLSKIPVISSDNTSLDTFGDKDNTCHLCFNDNTECMIQLPCYHTMCSKCFRQWYWDGRHCSLCTICKGKFYYSNCYYALNKN